MTFNEPIIFNTRHHPRLHHRIYVTYIHKLPNRPARITTTTAVTPLRTELIHCRHYHVIPTP